MTCAPDRSGAECAAEGAIAGLASGVAFRAGAPLLRSVGGSTQLRQVGLGAISDGAGSAAGQLLTTGRVDWTRVAEAAMVGGALGAVTTNAVPRRGMDYPLFTQRTASPRFSNGELAGRSIGEVADDIRLGKVKPSQLPIAVIRRGDDLLALNTRSMLALRRAGVPMKKWNLRDMTGVDFLEGVLDERLKRNVLSHGETTIRITGRGGSVSNLE